MQIPISAVERAAVMAARLENEVAARERARIRYESDSNPCVGTTVESVNGGGGGEQGTKCGVDSEDLEIVPITRCLREIYSSLDGALNAASTGATSCMTALRSLQGRASEALVGDVR